LSEWATPTTMDSLPPKSETALHHEMTSARPGRSRPANPRDQVCNAENWPTPSANKMTCSGNLTCADGSPWDGVSKPHSEATGRPAQTALADVVMHRETWPTPTVHGNYNVKGMSKNSGDGLATAVAERTWPTPTQSDGTGGPGTSAKRQGGENLRTAVGKRLNPTWVELLMGWPAGLDQCANFHRGAGTTLEGTCHDGTALGAGHLGRWCSSNI
jgi:hypothetical protein